MSTLVRNDPLVFDCLIKSQLIFRDFFCFVFEPSFRKVFGIILIRVFSLITRAGSFLIHFSKFENFTFFGNKVKMNRPLLRCARGCGYEQRDRSNMTKHERYSCPNRSAEEREAVRSHCIICGRDYHSPDALRAHMRNDHPVNGLEPGFLILYKNMIHIYDVINLFLI